MIEIRNLRVVYKNTTVFQNFSAKIESKGITLILGPSGSGKTTLLNCIAHRIPYRGNISVDGKFYRKNDAICMKKISYCSFESFLFEEESIADFLFRCYPQNRREEIFFYLERYGLFPYRFERIDALSVGQKELLKIVYCFLSDAEYLIFDEPTASLDRNRIRLFIEDIRRFSRQKAIVISTHEAMLMKETDQHIDVCKCGEIVSDKKEMETFKLPQMKEKRKIEVSGSKWNRVFMMTLFIFPFVIGLFFLLFNGIWDQTHYLNEDELVLLNEDSGTSSRMSNGEFASIIDGCEDILYGGFDPDWNLENNFTFIYKNRIEITLERQTVQKINQSRRSCVVYENRDIENERDAQRVSGVRISEKLFSWIADFFPEEVKLEDLKLKYGSRELVVRSCYPNKKIEISMPYERLFMDKNFYDPLEIIFGMPDGYHDPTVSYIGIGSRLDLTGWDEKDVRIEERNRVYFPNEEMYRRWIESEDVEGKEAMLLPYASGVKIAEGRIPSKEREILLPSYAKECGITVGDSFKKYSVCGFFEDPVFKSDRYYFAYSSTEDAYSGKICRDPLIFHCDQKEAAERYLKDRGYFVADEREYSKVLIQPIIPVLIGSSAALLVAVDGLMIFIEMKWIDRKNQKMFLLGIHRNWLMKKRLKYLMKIPLVSVLGQAACAVLLMVWMFFFPYTWMFLLYLLIPFWISTGISVLLIVILQWIRNFDGQAI